MDKKKLFFTLLLIVVCILLFVRRFIAPANTPSYDITTEVANNNIEINFSSNDLYIKGEDIPYAILRFGEDYIDLNENIIKTINVKAKSSVILSLPQNAKTVVVNGSGNVYINNIAAEQLVLSAANLELDDANIDKASLNAKESTISSSSFSTLYVKGSSKPITIINSSAKSIMTETISGDITIDSTATFIEAKSDSGNIDLTINQDSHIVSSSENGIIEIDDGLDKIDSENTVLIKTNSGNIRILGDNDD